MKNKSKKSILAKSTSFKTLKNMKSFRTSRGSLNKSRKSVTFLNDSPIKLKK